MSVAWMLLMVCLAAGARAEGDVLDLTSATFEDTIKNNKYVLVEFFAPWCGHCKSLAPEYAKAATALKAHGVVLAAVDATQEQQLARSHEVKGFPALRFFKNGVSSDYGGGRTEGKIVKWVLKAIGAPLQVVADVADLQSMAGNNKVLVAGFVAEGSPEQQAVQGADRVEPELNFVLVHDPAMALAFGVEIPSLVVFKSWEDKAVLPGPFTQEVALDFVGVERLPFVIPFTMESAADVFQSKIKQVCFYFGETPNADFNAVAQKYRGKFVFATSDGSMQRLNDHVGVSKDKFPQLLILALGSPMLRYPLEGAITASSIEQHLEQFQQGLLRPTLKSEPEPANNDGPVKVVVGTTFESIVMDPAKNVLLEVYAPWCGHCKSLAPVYEELGAGLKDRSDIVIAKLDGTANEVEGVSWKSFPTLKFYKAGEKQREGRDYQGGRDLESLKTFVLQNSAAARPAATAHEDL